ncbi:uncharacterized protein SOCEGT47_063820 [Sorangium cellulosum]|uniref:Uncharacterized protein n=1 Tax=Sorangium cellulosum TaxID=56 RepID=A0A4P2Q8K5_SORCE|nr:hypothetical protein [Sorangium cellulosum]AUX25829.1 uncharacterized protein SOCEGT47_063820 [Sorangium cellulosum]
MVYPAGAECTFQVRSLIGPEENGLAREVQREVKALGVCHTPPGYAARSEAMGGWVRLAPSSFDVGCTLGRTTEHKGVS